MKEGLFAMEMVKITSEKEVVRKRGRRSDWDRQLVGQVRSVFVFLLVATIFVYAFCKEEELQDFVFARLDNLSQVATKSDSLRQSALNHEKEVNEVASEP